MRREGPSFLTWLWGLCAHPPSRARCSSCGAQAAGGEAVRRLEAEGLSALAERSRLCADCRRLALAVAAAQRLEGGS
ncbi:MAG: hypothetical protein HYZ28_17595 [Myxococcales bacterium]|nr:hypothetical protein [Myxococcales bacterium]